MSKCSWAWCGRPRGSWNGSVLTRYSFEDAGRWGRTPPPFGEPPRLDDDRPLLRPDQAVTPQLLQAAIHIDGGHPGRVGELGLGDWHRVAVAVSLPECPQPHEQLAQQGARCVRKGASTRAGIEQREQLPERTSLLGRSIKQRE